MWSAPSHSRELWNADCPLADICVMWAGQQAGPHCLVTPTRAQEVGPWEGNVDIAQFPEEGRVFASAALLGWLVWTSQLGDRQVLGTQE